ncbi:hypothetical protein SNA_36070 [Streptomyces natalensis ATCC 27448]|uniref:Uncharacterized protein n=1 Tax=Streptomyces natalensis ATCC 27448 TaxID=1240678 RepID=A0A0D7CEK7_9ACTN|nr:hypothetical protein SNA_36070 [Streptomyces natalensis ATCC 27448]
MVMVPEQHMRCPRGGHEITQVGSWMYRCDDHGVTVVTTSTAPERQPQLDQAIREQRWDG